MTEARQPRSPGETGRQGLAWRCGSPPGGCRQVSPNLRAQFLLLPLLPVASRDSESVALLCDCS